MKKLTTLVAAAALLFSAVEASAAVIRQFEVTNNAGGVAAVGTDVYNGGNPYAFWINDSNLTGGGNKHFTLSSTGSMSVFDNGTAALMMSITNGLRSYDVSVSMALANPAYGPKYPNNTYKNYVESNGLLPWTSWEIVSGSLNDGATQLYSLGASPGTGGQEGVAANWINPFEYGFSSWVDGTANNPICMYQLGSNCTASVNMDINVGLTRVPVGVVPLPAGMVLLLSGIGGLGLVARRRKIQA